jgi:hypothetical protein
MSASNPSSQPTSARHEQPKKVYVRPQLKRLGSVRDITLGATSGSNEFGMRA